MSSSSSRNDACPDPAFLASQLAHMHISEVHQIRDVINGVGWERYRKEIFDSAEDEVFQRGGRRVTEMTDSGRDLTELNDNVKSTIAHFIMRKWTEDEPSSWSGSLTVLTQRKKEPMSACFPVVCSRKHSRLKKDSRW